MHRFWFALVVATGPLIGKASLVAAQEQTLTITLRGAPQGTPISAVVNGTRQFVDRLGATANILVSSTVLNAGKGTRVRVHIDSHGQQPEVVLVPEGQTDPACRAEQAEREPGCEPIGTVVLGVSTGAIITFADGVATFKATGPAAAGMAPGVAIGITAFGTDLYRLKENACASPVLTDCKTDDRGLGLGLFAEYRLLPLLALGLGISRSTYSIVQETGPVLAPIHHELDTWMLDAYLRGAWQATPMLAPWVTLGTSQIWNDLTTTGSDGEEFSKTESGPRVNLGAGLDIGLRTFLRARLFLNLVRGLRRDADSHVRFGAGVVLNTGRSAF